MRQQNIKGNFNKHTNNAYGYGNPNEYEHYKVEKPTCSVAGMADGECEGT